MSYEIVIGLEVHSELNTFSKIFCSCKNEFGGEPNSHCCPGCSGMPGMLPVLNKKAIEYAVKAGLALNCKIANYSVFDRKHYFYPDLPNAYQTTQLGFHLCQGGWVSVNVDGNEKIIRLNRIHVEEDAGKLVHSEWGHGTLVDLNRTTVPLIEIVTEPDMRSPEEAVAFLENLRSILIYTGVSDCKMEQGSLRCDVNLSVRKVGAEKFGTRVEMKNINSFKAAYRAMQYESKRQIRVLEEGGTLVQETRRWDDVANKSISMRTKEDAHDYRYFPDPDLTPVVLADDEIEAIRKTLPLMPKDRQKKYIEQYNLPKYDAEVLTVNKYVSDFFDESVAKINDPKLISNWVMGDVLRKLKDSASEDMEIPISVDNFIELINLFKSNTISQTAAKQVFDEMWMSGNHPKKIVDEKGLIQINDTSELEVLVKEIIANNPKPAEDYRSGNEKAIAFFVGQLMKATKGKANPNILNDLLKKELGK